jgi:hypothetical protein
LDFQQKQINMEMLEKFKENIAIQSEVIETIKNRAEKY